MVERMPMTPLSDRLRELDEGATPGPWSTRGVVVEAFSPGRISPLRVADVRRDEIDATLIATLRNALPAIREVVRWSHEVLLTAADEPFDKLEAALAALTAQMEEMERKAEARGVLAAKGNEWRKRAQAAEAAISVFQEQSDLQEIRAEAAEARVTELEEWTQRVSETSTAAATAAEVAEDALNRLMDEADELRLWEPGRKGYAAAHNRFFYAIDTLRAEKLGIRPASTQGALRRDPQDDLRAVVERYERALREAGDLLFGTWDDDSTPAERNRKAEGIFRAALSKTPESTPQDA